MDRFHSLLDSVFEFPFARLIPIAVVVLSILLVLHGIFALNTPRKRELLSKRMTGAIFVYIAFGLVVSVLALTSFGAILLDGKMEHEALLVHIMAAGAFTAIMVVFAYVWNPVFGRPTSISNECVDSSTNGWWVARWSLWLVLLSSLGVAASMLLGMLPLFDTEQMHLAVALHRYCGLSVVVGLIIHLYALAIQRAGLR